MEACCVAGHGLVEDEVWVDGVRAVVARHPPGVLDAHAHETAKLVVLLDGGAAERIGLELVEHRRYEVVARSRLRAHENQYHACGARSLIVELDAAAKLHGHLEPAAAAMLGRRLVHAFHAPRASRRRQVSAAVSEIVAAFERPRRGAPAWLDAARERLFARLEDPPPLDELARALGVHVVHLAQAFRRQFAHTPMGYVRAHRVFRAVDLAARGAPLARIAAETGFADQSHMTRAITRARGAPPAALRRAMKPSP